MLGQFLFTFEKPDNLGFLPAPSPFSHEQRAATQTSFLFWRKRKRLKRSMSTDF